MIYLITVLVILPILALFNKDRVYGIIYVILLYFFLPVVSFYLFPSVAYRIFFPINIAVLTLFGVSLLKEAKLSSFNLSLLIFVPLFFLTIGLASLYTGQNVVTDIYFFRNHFFNLFLFSSVCLLDRKSLKMVLAVILGIVFFEAFLGFLQSQNQSISDAFKFDYLVKDGLSVSRFNYGDEVAKIVTGTLLAMSNVTNFLAVSILVMILYFDSFKSKKFILVCIVLALTTIVFSGIRSSLGALLIMVFVYALYHKPIFFFISLIPLFILFQMFQEYIEILGQLASYQAFGFDNPVLRLAGLFSVINSTDSEQLMTFGRTIDLASQYDLSLPFGNGTNISYENYDSPTDAYLMTMIVDYGWFVLMLLVIPYFGMIYLIYIKTSKSHAIKALIVLSLLLILTTVDEGLWYQVCNFVFILYCGMVVSAFSKNPVHKGTKSRPESIISLNS